MRVANTPTILVAARTNGVGKSPITQPFIESADGAYFNPDQFARAMIEGGMPPRDANAKAWTRGFDRLCSVVERGFAFETTGAVFSTFSGSENRLTGQSALSNSLAGC